MENTANDLSACVEDVQEALDNNLTFAEFKEQLSSDYERRGFDKLVELCKDFIDAVESFEHQ
jgi:hypothetical protein